MDEADERAAARLNSAAEWAWFTVCLLVGTILALAMSVAVLVAHMLSLLEQAGTPV